MKIGVVQILYGVAVICAAVLAFYFFNQGVHARNALCSLENDFRTRVTDTRKFVDENGGPKGQAIQGLSNKVLLQNANSQERTANVLESELNCEN